MKQTISTLKKYYTDTIKNSFVKKDVHLLDVDIYGKQFGWYVNEILNDVELSKRKQVYESILHELGRELLKTKIKDKYNFHDFDFDYTTLENVLDGTYGFLETQD